jgi:type IV secretion system protein VirB10
MSDMEKPQPAIDDVERDAELLPKVGDTPTGVRRVNNMPLVIIGGVLVVFVVLVAMVASQRGMRKKRDTSGNTSALPENSQLLDQMLANGATGGLIADPDENLSPSFAVARVTDRDKPPIPETGQGLPAGGSESDDIAKGRMKMFQTAMQARTGVTNAQTTPTAPASSSDEKEEKGLLDELKGAGARDERIPVSADGDYARFDRPAGKDKGRKEDRWLLASDVEKPRTSYEVRAGSVIPATMISGINSELPGQIVAQVSQDVFDTPTGRHRVIPQGSKLVGRYNHQVVLGQSRVLVAWQRIVFPDGKALDIGAMEGADSAGYAGFGDQVDRHYWRVFGSAILMSGITAGLTSSRVDPGNDPFGSSNAATLSQSLAQQIGEVATKMIEKNLNTAPTLGIRPGYRFNVMAVKDLTFEKPYQPFDY